MMRLAVLIGLLAFLPSTRAFADAIVAQCPLEWTFGTERKPLVQANMWTDIMSVDDFFEEPEERPGRTIYRVNMSKLSENPYKPIFLRCLYARGGGFEVVVLIPDGATTCMVEWEATQWDAREKVNRKSVRPLRAECRGPLQGEPSQPFQVEAPSLSSDIAGLRLRRSAEELKAEVLSRGGQWEQAGEGVPAEIVLDGERLRVMFSSTSGLSRKIILFGPPWPSHDEPLRTAIIRRFGAPDYAGLSNTTDAWNARYKTTEVQVEWYRSYVKDGSGPPQEMRLVDRVDPENKMEQR